MTPEQVADNVVRVPQQYWERCNIGPYDLLRESGYFDVHSDVTAEVIARALMRYPAGVDDWMQFCSDKRTDEGWYINRRSHDVYVVGYLPRERTRPGADLHRQSYSDAVTATAAYIKHEIESMRRD